MSEQAKPTGWGGPPVPAPTLEEVRGAAEWLRGQVVRTPLLAFTDVPGRKIHLKPETLQPIGSYKIRGALNWARTLDQQQRARGFSTCSAGNTAQAVGYAANRYGVSARSLLPDSVPDNKLAAIEAHGVTPVCVPYDELILYMLEERWRSEPYSYLNPWGEPAMMAGSGTIALEIFEDLPDVETVYVPVGGGGLAAGVGSVFAALRPSVRVVGVQSTASPALSAAFAAGHSVWVESRPTICEGTAVPVIVEQMLPLLRQVVDDVVLVSDDDARAAIRRLALESKLVAEGSGAITLAAALADPRAGGGPVVCIVSGGSINAARLTDALS